MATPSHKALYEELLPSTEEINRLQTFFPRNILGIFYTNAEDVCKMLQKLETSEQLRWYKNYVYLYQLYFHYAENLNPDSANSVQAELIQLRQQLERTKVNESTIFKTWKSLSAENDDLHTEIAKLRHQLQTSATAVTLQPQQEKEIASLKSQVQELTSRCHDLGERLEKSYDTIKKLKEDASSAKEKLRQAETEIAVGSKPAESFASQEELQKLQRENWELRNQNQMLAQSSMQTQANLQQCYEVIRNLRAQIQDTGNSEPAPNSNPPEEAIPLLQTLMQAQIQRTELTQELRFYQLERDCISECIAEMTPETDDFQLPVLQKRLSENIHSCNAIQEQLRQTEAQISELHSKLNLIYL